MAAVAHQEGEAREVVVEWEVVAAMGMVVAVSRVVAATVATTAAAKEAAATVALVVGLEAVPTAEQATPKRRAQSQRTSNSPASRSPAC